MATDPPDLRLVAERLRSLLARYGDGLVEIRDHPGAIALEAPGPRRPENYFAGLRHGRRYVSYYLMPVYSHPELLDEVSPELRRRMQGKSCFNFTKVDEPLFEELDRLTAASRDRFRSDQGA